MTNPFFGAERRTKGWRFLWLWVQERSEGKYSEWRGGTTQCQRDSPLYISIPGAVKKLNVSVKNDSKEESSILNLKLYFFNIIIIACDCDNFAWSVNSFNNKKVKVSGYRKGEKTCSTNLYLWQHSCLQGWSSESRRRVGDINMQRWESIQGKSPSEGHLVQSALFEGDHALWLLNKPPLHACASQRSDTPSSEVALRLPAVCACPPDL